MVGISIIVTNYNGANLLRRFLPSVVKAAKAYFEETEIIVVDGSPLLAGRCLAKTEVL
jgi:glycosyltransferase involved in cell wall biosynthesis